ncbi:hypothetical protein H4S14_002964 [Agrobacterium vitis]|nr:hypothetical protein [Agrobacterium vitis]MBE1439202.1 hypothetical protein [Agrobacterium vitis]
MSMSFSLTGSDLAAALRRMAEDAARRAAAKRLSERQKQSEERDNDQPGE